MPHLVCKNSVVVKLDYCIRSHSRTTIPTSPFLENRQLSKFCVSCSSNRTDVQKFSVCLELNYRDENLHLAIYLLFVLWRSSEDVAETTRTRKWKWLFVNCCRFRSPISVATKFVYSWRDDMIALMCLETMLKIMLVRCNKLTTINAAVISRLIFIT
jgi:hypothetical protein